MTEITNDLEQPATDGYVALRRELSRATSESRRSGRNPSIVLLGRIQHDIIQAKLDGQWGAFEKANDWRDAPPAVSATNGMYFRGLRIVLVADVNLLQVYEGTGDWK